VFPGISLPGFEPHAASNAAAMARQMDKAAMAAMYLYLFTIELIPFVPNWHPYRHCERP